MIATVLWPPPITMLPDWDNGAGVAVMCGASQHRVVRRGDEIMPLDHAKIDLEVSEARSTLGAGHAQLLGYRLYSPGFIEDDLARWRKGRTWTDSGQRGLNPSIVGQVEDPAGLAACVRLVIEGFVPCNWCGTLLHQGNACTPDDDWTCALSNAGGWKKAIPPGWVQATLVGAPRGLDRVWPRQYRWMRNGPFTHHRQLFLSSPWFPALHPRRLKNLICEFAADQGSTLGEAVDQVIHQLTEEFGPMKPPPPITYFHFDERRYAR